MMMNNDRCIPNENRAIFLDLGSSNMLTMYFKAPSRIKSLHNVGELRARFPSAPAAFERVFSSGSPKTS